MPLLRLTSAAHADEASLSLFRFHLSPFRFENCGLQNPDVLQRTVVAVGLNALYALGYVPSVGQLAEYCVSAVEPRCAWLLVVFIVSEAADIRVLSFSDRPFAPYDLEL